MKETQRKSNEKIRQDLTDDPEKYITHEIAKSFYDPGESWVVVTLRRYHEDWSVEIYDTYDEAIRAAEQEKLHLTRSPYNDLDDYTIYIAELRACIEFEKRYLN